jgi:hypothetical protein
MMADNDVEVRLGAETGALEAGMNAAADKVKSATQKITESLKSTEAIGVAVGTAVGNVLVKAFENLSATLKSTVTDTAAYYKEAANLSRVLGVTATEAGTLMQALDNIGSSSDEYTSAIKGMERQLRTNEQYARRPRLDAGWRQDSERVQGWRRPEYRFAADVWSRACRRLQTAAPHQRGNGRSQAVQ